MFDFVQEALTTVCKTPQQVISPNFLFKFLYPNLYFIFVYYDQPGGDSNEFLPENAQQEQGAWILKERKSHCRSRF